MSDPIVMFLGNKICLNYKSVFSRNPQQKQEVPNVPNVFCFFVLFCFLISGSSRVNYLFIRVFTISCNDCYRSLRNKITIYYVDFHPLYKTWKPSYYVQFSDQDTIGIDIAI